MAALANDARYIAPEDPSRFFDFRLNSVFQPIFGLGHRRIVGYEALVRGSHHTSARPVSPIELFTSASETQDMVALDRQCQRLHIESFSERAPKDRWLFLNVNTKSLDDRRYLDDYLERVMSVAGLSFDRLVIEILESSAIDKRALFDAVDYFRSLGALIALDDFGTGHSNFDRIWRLAPDIVKLDRSIINDAARYPTGKLRRTLPSLVAMLHEAESMVLVEGIETREQALIALDADADFAQGFYLAKPQSTLDDFATGHEILHDITDRFLATQNRYDYREQQALSPYIDAFRAVPDKFEPSESFDRHCQRLLTLPRVIHCLLFNEQGEPITRYRSSRLSIVTDKRFAPLAQAQGGAWFRRHYFRDTVTQPGRLRVSRPYLSSTDGCMCIMLSIASTNTPVRVFCCELTWHDRATHSEGR